MPKLPPLAPDRRSRCCDPAEFDFETTAALAGQPQPFGQARAVDTVRLALDTAGRGYNVFVLGEPGSSRTVRSATCSRRT